MQSLARSRHSCLTVCRCCPVQNLLHRIWCVEGLPRQPFWQALFLRRSSDKPFHLQAAHPCGVDKLTATGMAASEPLKSVSDGALTGCYPDRCGGRAATVACHGPPGTQAGGHQCKRRHCEFCTQHGKTLLANLPVCSGQASLVTVRHVFSDHI